MTHGECKQWLIELAYLLLTNREKSKTYVPLMRPRPASAKPLRIGWVGPDSLGGNRALDRLTALGKVLNAEFVVVAPIHFHHVKARLAESQPLDSVIIGSGFAPYITSAVAPATVSPESISYCNDTRSLAVEQHAAAWVEALSSRIEEQQLVHSPTDDLLKIMLRGMFSHDKIGPFNHCQKQTVMRRVRARHLNVSHAERILDANSELFHDTKPSACLFLWKNHNDGDQYFLNSSEIERAKIIVG